MDELLRYVVSINPVSKAVKVEQIGEAGELTEVDLSSFIQALGVGAVGAISAPQIVINVYGGGYSGGSAEAADSKGTPPSIMGFRGGPPPPPPHNKPGKPGKE